MLRLENLAKLYGLKVVFKGVSCRFTAGMHSDFLPGVFLP